MLIAFWISYPKDLYFPRQGVTALSRADAFRMLEAHGYDFHVRAVEVLVREGIAYDDIEDAEVRRHMGPIVVRGIWYPCLNIGYNAPRAW